MYSTELQTDLPSEDAYKLIRNQTLIMWLLSKYALPRARRVWEAEYAIGISGKTIKLGRPNTFTVVKNGQPIVIDTVRGEPSMFRNGWMHSIVRRRCHSNARY